MTPPLSDCKTDNWPPIDVLLFGYIILEKRLFSSLVLWYSLSYNKDTSHGKRVY